jgi:hypothetical protein
MKWLVFAIGGVLFCAELSAQRLIMPEASPQASVSQSVGLTDMTITYHRPGVKNRKVWGDLVPYNEVWRVGANENTTIAFSTPVRIGGKELPAGTYGLHMIPTEQQWTVILSANSTSWGSYFYNDKEDVVRFTVKPEAGEFTERLLFTFSNIKDNASDVVMSWEKVRIGFTVEIDLQATVLTSLKGEMRSSKGFSWEALRNGASWCLRNNVNLDEAMAWADRSIQRNEHFSNVLLKSQILAKQVKSKEADEIFARAVKLAVTEADLNQLGYHYLSGNKAKEAVDVFKRIAKEHPASWNAHDSLAEALEKSGDKKGALENYRKAMELVKDQDQKLRLEKNIKTLTETK